MSVFPGSISPGGARILWQVLYSPRTESGQGKNSSCLSGMVRGWIYSGYSTCLLEALYSVDGTRHGKRSEETGGWCYSSLRHIQVQNFKAQNSIWDFLGGPVAKTPPMQGLGSIPDQN